MKTFFKRLLWPFAFVLLLSIAVISSTWAGLNGFVSEFLDKWQWTFPSRERLTKGFRSIYLKK